MHLLDLKKQHPNGFSPKEQGSFLATLNDDRHANLPSWKAAQWELDMLNGMDVPDPREVQLVLVAVRMLCLHEPSPGPDKDLWNATMENRLFDFVKSEGILTRRGLNGLLRGPNRIHGVGATELYKKIQQLKLRDRLRYNDDAKKWYVPGNVYK